MSPVWLIATREFKRRVLTKGFVLVVLSLPLLLVLILGLGLLTDYLRYNGRPVGYVDRSGLLANPVPPPERFAPPVDRWLKKPVALLPYASEDAARADLLSGNLQAYYVLPTDYVLTMKVEVFCLTAASENATGRFGDLLRANLLSGRPPAEVLRASEGALLTVRTPDGSREVNDRAPWGPLLPLIFVLALILWFGVNAGSLMGAISEEKENRTIEVLLTTVSPSQFIGGKVLGVVGAGLAQLGGWAMCVFLIRWGGSGVMGPDWIRQVYMPARTLATLAAVALPNFVFYAGLMLTLGATLTDTQESSQLAGVFMLAFMAPFWALQTIIERPNTSLPIVLSLLPLASVSTLGFRLSFESVPVWQIGLSIAMVSLCAGAAVWLAGRAFRLGMLRYGQRLTWSELVRRPRPEALPGGKHG